MTTTSRATVFVKGRPITPEMATLINTIYARLSKGLDLPGDVVQRLNDFGCHITYYGGEASAPSV
jgi:hypothetical protein